MCDVDDCCPQGIGNSKMAGDLLLGILSRLVSLTYFVLTRTHAFAGLLTRLQLHIPAAGIRKHIELEEIRSSALVRQRIACIELMWLSQFFLPS